VEITQRRDGLRQSVSAAVGILAFVLYSPVYQLPPLLFNCYLRRHLRLANLASFFFDGDFGV
jgi:hypothetical protein